MKGLDCDGELFMARRPFLACLGRFNGVRREESGAFAKGVLRVLINSVLLKGEREIKRLIHGPADVIINYHPVWGTAEYPMRLIVRGIGRRSLSDEVSLTF